MQELYTERNLQIFDSKGTLEIPIDTALQTCS